MHSLDSDPPGVVTSIVIDVETSRRFVLVGRLANRLVEKATKARLSDSRRRPPVARRDRRD